MPTVVVEQPLPGVTQLTLNRPDTLNALTAEMVTEVHDALDAIAADRACRAVVLTGAGRGFCAGIDLGGYGTPPGAEGLPRVQAGFTTQQHIAALVPHLRSLPVPVIAAVNGPAAGGGLAIALASDVRIAAASARFNVAFVRIGLSGCDIGTSWLLPRLVGASRAFELLLTGRVIDASEADHIGLVTKVVPDGDVVAAALETAQLVAANSPWGVRMTKEVMWSQLEVGSLQAGIDLENRTQVLSTFTGDMVEATQAFFEKRPARFVGLRRAQQTGWPERPAERSEARAGDTGLTSPRLPWRRRFRGTETREASAPADVVERRLVDAPVVGGRRVARAGGRGRDHPHRARRATVARPVLLGAPGIVRRRARPPRRRPPRSCSGTTVAPGRHRGELRRLPR